MVFIYIYFFLHPLYPGFTNIYLTYSYHLPSGGGRYTKKMEENIMAIYSFIISSFAVVGMLFFKIHMIISERNKQVGIYIDLDGVLAIWRKVSIEATMKKGFFLSAKADLRILYLVRMLKDSGCKVCILSASYNKDTSKEKAQWLKQIGLGDVDYMFVPYGCNKADFIKDKNAILIDDFTNNLYAWQNKRDGLVGVKYYNGINGTKKRWYGNFITCKMTSIQMFNTITELAVRMKLISDANLK